MGEYVWVESFEALKRLRVALCRFAEVVNAALGEADAELQRERDWVKVERSTYWKEEAKKRAEILAKAKIALAGKKFETTPLGGRASCVEEEKELARARRLVEEAERKLANLRHWRRRIDEEIFTYQAVASGLGQALAGDVPRALARLDNMLAALEAYATSTAPQMQGSVAAGAEEAGLGAGPELESMARPVSMQPGEVGDWRRLRERTPSTAVRDTAPPAVLDKGWRPGDGLRPAWGIDLVDRLGLARVPVALEDKVLLAHGAAEQPRVYLERLADVGTGDSGWYVGRVDDDAAPGYDATCVSDLLAARPDLAALLELPPGCLVVLHGVALEAVFDAADNRRWPVAEAASR